MVLLWRLFLWKIPVMLLVLFLSRSIFAIEIGDGEIYQQPNTSSYVSDDLILLPGGTIVGREDGYFTSFRGDHIYQISGGVVDTRLSLDASSNVTISGGVFKNYLDISRMFGDVEISGGLFQSIVDIGIYTGDVVVSGGVFNDYFRISYSTSGGATPTFTLKGYNWKIDGVPVNFPTDIVEISSYSGGQLTGYLSDGSEFSRFISTGQAGMAPVGSLFLLNTASSPEFTCDGFFAPFDYSRTISKKAKGTIPVKMELKDEYGYPMTDADITAPPVINVTFNSTVYGNGSTDDAALESVGSSNDGNLFSYNAAEGQWEYRLGTKQFSSAGTYQVTVASGDTGEYTISNGVLCSQSFIRLE